MGSGLNGECQVKGMAGGITGSFELEKLDSANMFDS